MAGRRRRGQPLGLRWREIWNKVWWCMPVVVSDSPRLMFVVEAKCYLMWQRDWIWVKHMAALNGGGVLGGGGALQVADGGGALQVNLFNQSHHIMQRSFSQFLWDKETISCVDLFLNCEFSCWILSSAWYLDWWSTLYNLIFSDY